MRRLRSLSAPFLLVAVLAVPGSAAAQTAPPAPPPSSAGVQVSTAEARKLSDAFVAVAERVSPSVVQIEVATRNEKADTLMRLLGVGGESAPVNRGTGSGVVLTPDGAILTNNHVVEEALTITVRLRDGRILPARLIGRDPATDLAVIKVDAQGLVPAKVADSDAVKVGEWVVAIGSPFGLGYTVTAGVISAKGRGGLGMNAIEDYLQTDASINPGNSGGPLCNLDGQVVGINTMVVGRGSGIGFAVPTSMARRVAEQLLRTGKVQRAWIGVSFQDLTPELGAAMGLDPRAGALVSNVIDGSPAAKAGLKPGDVIGAVANKPVRDGRELSREILAHEVGETVPVEVLRQGKRYAAQIRLAPRPEPEVPPAPVQLQTAPQQGFGAAVRALTPQQAVQLGLPAKELPIVTTVSPGSSADRAGIRSGDVIVEADGIVEPSMQQLEQAAADGRLLVRIRRGEAAFYAALKK
jgi:Do/DeqQ family serine protease